jgi:putative membrane protein
MTVKRIAPMCLAWLVWFASSVSISMNAFAQDDRLSDAQMVGVLIVANQAQIAAGQLALRRTQSPSMRNLANRMVSENAQVNQEANAMLQRLGANAQRSGTSDAIARQSRNDLADLNDAADWDFDLAFLNDEVSFLGRLVKAIDAYIRATTSPDVKVLLVRARPVFTFHLDQARQMQYALNRPNFGR